ncbi:MAG TPA: 4Fe-4S binding protein [Desulfobacterales bacterium]|nr:4Fe-4S binding protein [Desulfobacterales bacterium]
MTDVYQRLANHLDNLPGGFPATETGVELRILKRLFSKAEAEMVPGLTMMPEPVSAIAARMDRDPAGLAAMLEDMSKKGLIFRLSKGGKKHYMAAQFLIGIWEYHLNDLDEDLIRDVNEYLPHFMKAGWVNQKTRQLRVVPISKSISADISVMPYEKAEEIVKRQSKIVVSPCICRREHEMVGKGCDKPRELCLIFGSGAYYYEENGLGRSITQDEALAVLNTGLEAGLVLQPGNAQKPSNICMCCGCCCQILKNLRSLERPARVVHSNYYAEVAMEDCNACEACADRCQMDAIEVEDTARVDRERCIGCGLCVTECPVDAMTLKQKAAADQYVPPKNTFETYLTMARERGKI